MTRLNAALLLATLVLLPGCARTPAARPAEERNVTPVASKAATVAVPAAPYRAPLKTKADVLALVSRFSPGEKLSDVHGPDKRDIRPFWEVSGEAGRMYWVDAKQALVITVMGPIRWKPVAKSELPLTSEKASARAEEFVRAHYPAFKVVRFDKVRTDVGGNTEFRWTGRGPQDMELPREVVVSVDLKTGTLGGYRANDSQLTAVPVPRVSREQAEAAVRKIAPTASIESVRLVALSNTRGEVRAVWQFGVVSRGPTAASVASFPVDAVTGQLAGDLDSWLHPDDPRFQQKHGSAPQAVPGGVPAMPTRP
jgi:hypothetical protein